MFLFIARHGEAENVKDYWQAPDSKLDELGENQSKALGGLLKAFKIDQVFSSDWERSLSTAKIISKEIKVELETLDYIHEREQLPEIYGASRDSSVSKKYIEEYRNNIGNLDWKFEGKEESLREVIDRTSKLLSFLTKNYQGKRVLVVSHDLFIRCLIGNVLLGKDYADKDMFGMINNIVISNTGLSLLIHNSQRKIWQINYINNYSHLN